MDDRAVRGIPWTLMTYAGNRMISVLGTIVLARLLAPSDFGLFALAVVIESALGVFTGVWLGAALVVRPNVTEREKGTVLTLLCAASGLFTAVMLAVAPLTAVLFDEPRLTGIVAAMAYVMLINGPNWFYETILQRELEFRKRFVAQTVQTLAYTFVALALALLGAGVWSLVLGYVGGYVAHLVALLVLTPYRVRPAYDPVLAKRVMKSGRGFLAQDLSSFLAQNVDYIAVGRTLGSGPLGLYSMAYRQADLPNQAIADPVGRVTFPAFAQMRHRGESVTTTFLTALRLVALVTCPIAVILSAAAAPFTLAFFGARWAPMIAPLSILGIWAVVSPLRVTVGRLLNSFDRADIYGTVAMVSLIPFAVATFVAARAGGIATVAWVLLVHMVLTFVVLAIAVARWAEVPLSAQARTLWPPVVAGAISWAATRLTVEAAGGAPPVVSLTASTCVCLVTYVAALAAVAPGVLRETIAQAQRMLGPRARMPAAWGSALERARRSGPATLAVLACPVAAVFVGALSGVAPGMAVGLVGGGVLVALAFAAPVTHLLLLIAITEIVPYSLQQTFSLGGGHGVPGLFVADVLLLTGLQRARLVLMARPPKPGARAAVALVGAFLCLCVLQAVHSLRDGTDVSDVGGDLRVVLGFGALLIALPILDDRAARDRLLTGLVFIGLALGLWGIAQWVVDIPFSAAGDAGVRAGVRFTTAGRGQLQGGLYGFPVAVVLSFAALMAPVHRSATARTLLVAVLALNLICLFLTYERTFWLATLAGLLIVAARAPRAHRATAVVAGVAALGATIAFLAVVAPAELAAGSQRLTSIGDYSSDISVRYREQESTHAMAAIRAHPIGGSGLGAAILWGRPDEGVRPSLQTFIHNGYLWFAWKLGVPGAMLLLALLGLSIARRPPPDDEAALHAMRVGAQSALLVLLIVNVTFTFSVLAITSTMGLLAAFCVSSGLEPLLRTVPVRGLVSCARG